MTTFHTHLLNACEIAEGTVEYVLQRPEGFTFQAGQHVNLKLERLNHEDKKGLRRTFTIASPPFQEAIHIVTRDTGSGFKRTLREGGQTLEMLGPLGKMTHDTALSAVFIAGGVGITPFHSMILAGLQDDAAAPMTLLYSNRSRASAVFLPLFEELASTRGDRFQLHFLLTGAEPSGRRIDRQFIREHVADLGAVLFYLCGPQRMVEEVRELLQTEAVAAERIRSEVFWGY